MLEPVLITGPNFSGRSHALRTLLVENGRHGFFVGPYAEAALSGLSSAVADEIEIYRSLKPLAQRPLFIGVETADAVVRRPATLSGGEQALLALHCFALSDYDAIGVDTALEQLDRLNRERALNFLNACGDANLRAVVIDNRVSQRDGWTICRSVPHDVGFELDFPGLIAMLRPQSAPVLDVLGLCFRYRSGHEIFRHVDLCLAPGRAYRLTGPNGSGKTTFFKILAGVLTPTGGRLLRNGAPYRPSREGNRVFALSMQNPDHQWCGATLAEDMARRKAQLNPVASARFPSLPVLASLAHKLGWTSLDQPLYEFPLAARKRLSWLWPLAGVMPWVFLDEPSVGQDQATRHELARAITHMAKIGHGVMVVTHDDEFAAEIPHVELRIQDRTIIQQVVPVG